jgi:hypothetical protein
MTANSPSNELSDDEVRKLLDWCREHAADADALTTLNDLGVTLLRPSVGKDAITVVHAILDELEKNADPSAHVHAHMMILLSTLLEHRTQRDAVDAILLRWMRHPKSFGPARATPPELQKEGFVQRLADALGWGAISLEADKEAIARFLSWVDTWAPKQKASAARIVAMLRRNFPQGEELWKLVRVELNRDKNHKGHERRERDRRSHKDRSKVEGSKPAEEGEASVHGEGATVVEGTGVTEGAAKTTDGTTTNAGTTADGKKQKKRRRRRRKRKPADGTTAVAVADAGALAPEGVQGPKDKGNGDAGADGNDSAHGGGEAAPSAAPETPPSGESAGG